MRTQLTLLVSLTLFLFGSSAYAMSGEELLEGLRDYANPNLSDAKWYGSGVSLGFVSGVAHVAIQYGIVCPKSSVSAKQLIAITKKYVEDNPSHWQLPAETLATNALIQAFPCTDMPKQGPPSNRTR